MLGRGTAHARGSGSAAQGPSKGLVREALLRILVFIEEEVGVINGFKYERGRIRIAF